MYLSTILTLCTTFALVTPQAPQQFIQNPCDSKSTCHECIRTPSCAWCFDTKFNTTKRCFQPSYPKPPLDQCDPSQVYNPDNVIVFLQNDNLTSSEIRKEDGTLVSGYEASMNSSEYFQGKGQSHFGGSGVSGGRYGASIVQVKPQRISLQLRAREIYRIDMAYARAEHYPVDLYYLMDLSKSMEDDKEKLSALGNHLADTMKRVTSNFTLGFGSFVDKVVMPYVSTIPEKLLQPCTGCVAPYGFRNHMTLSTNTNTFSQMVKEASVSGNLDAPEGGFDAIMQAVVCRQNIGWRDQTRRLLVFSTDAGFHYAGDGKLGGIVKPNDGECHLNNLGYYTMSSKQDYPSISQINTYVKKNSINVIFAVTADKVGIYKELATHIEGSTCGQLSNDSSNVVELIKEQYNAISSTVEMKHNASSDIKIRFFSKCLNSDGEMIETNKCGNVKFNTSVEFRVELQVLECPKNPRDWQQLIKIYPVGIDESLIIDLTMLCDCPCEHKGHFTYEEYSPQCKSAGTFMCGICDCNENAYGPHCECSKSGTVTNITTANCINPKTGLECSGRGSCVCGECVCSTRTNPEEIISGPQCECDNFSCERHNGLICSGPEHGVCTCGTCSCNKGWKGTDCRCRDPPIQCIAPLDRNINNTYNNETIYCSGHGTCECDTCVCNKPYFGPFCEKDFSNKTDDYCNTYKPCVQCRQYKTGPYKTEKECESNPICNFHIVEKDVIEVNETNNEVLCAHYDEETDCRFTFVYYYNETNQIEIRAQKELECPPIVFLLGVILGVIAAVVLMGLAVLLLWKLLTTIHDRREFAKFEKEAMMARWDTGENPIYKQATSTFKNPTYAGKG